MSEFRADLHCHTTCSDGTLSPIEIVKLAKQSGLSGLSITDHDSIEAYASILAYANEIDLALISGVEFSSIHHEVSVHILAYAFPLDSQVIHAFCERHEQRRKVRNQAILEKLSAINMPVSEEEVLACTLGQLSCAKQIIGRPHIAQAMVKKGYVSTIQEAFKQYIGEGKICYARGTLFSAEETLEIIHQAKGLAVIAHPHLIKEQQIVKELLEMKFDGIECYYGKFLDDQSKRWLTIAKKKGWLITGGSDFHGDIRPNIELGCSWVGNDHFDILQQHFKKNNELH